MAARLAQPAQSGGSSTSASSVRELIVIPELPNSTIQLQHAIQQVEVNRDSSGESSPNTDQQHTYITVASEGLNGVNYHVQYMDQQDVYTTQDQPHIETLRTYPVYNVTTGAEAAAAGGEAAWEAVYTPPAAEPPPAPAPRMPPATVTWLLDHYETADGVSLPRSTLYSHYLRHCAAHRLEPVNAASFGKLIRSVFVGLRTRRLGTRGNSKYHYYGIRAKPSAECSPPRQDKDIETQEDRSSDSMEQGGDSPECSSAHRQYLGSVRAPSPPPPPPPAADLAEMAALRRLHREHGAEFLEAVASLDTSAVERCRRKFWKRGGGAALPRRRLAELAARREVAAWLGEAELMLHQRAVELLLPDVLKPIPPHLTQSIRNFAKGLEAALSAGSAEAPAAARGALAAAGGALAAALRRYTSLNHLAQAARAVLANKHQIHQMLADLNRVDFRVVREQAAWACSSGSAAAAHRLEADFKATLGRGATLEQWAAWLEQCVKNALAAHENKPDYSARARRLLLDWSFYSSLVIRELTLRSAASFGSFHLIRLLYDEYVSYVIERRVAAHEQRPPIAVVHRALLAAREEEQAIEGKTTEDNTEEQQEEVIQETVISEVVDEDDPAWEWADDDEDEEIDSKRCKLEKL